MEQCVWPEAPRPAHAVPCDHCELKAHSPRVVWGEGNPFAEAWILLDNPGARENADHTPWVCGTRQTLYAAVAKAGFGADDCYLTYVLRRRPRRAYAKETERAQCLLNLSDDMAEHPPRLLLCLGDTAIRTFLGDPETSVRKTRQRWQQHHGLWLTATYHPLATRRRPALLSLLSEDLRFFFQRVQRPKTPHSADPGSDGGPSRILSTVLLPMPWRD